METFRCDRCGKPDGNAANKETLSGTVVKVTASVDPLKIGVWPANPNSRMTISNSLDLCPDCAKSVNLVLREWWTPMVTFESIEELVESFDE